MERYFIFRIKGKRDLSEGKGMKCEIVYEDDEILIVHKPAGLATQSARVGQPDAVSELKGYLAKKNRNASPYLGVVHRLDQPVEGLLAFAKTPKSAAALSKQLTQGALNKQYLAYVCGKPPLERGELVDTLRKEGNLAQVITGRESQYQDGKSAKLSYQVLHEKVMEDQILSILEIHIETGRFHQIRAQLSHAGWPILGDQKYGNEVSEGFAKKLGMKSVALCACRLECRHPATGKKLSWECKPEWS